jgi:nucleoside phosphorylase
MEILKKHFEAPYRTLISGVGIENSARGTLHSLEQERPGVLIFTGTSGIVDETVSVGEVLFPKQWCFRNGRCYGQSILLLDYLKDFGYHPWGMGLTVNQPVLTRHDRDQLSRKTEALVCDMESASVLRVAAMIGVPAIALKVVSDRAESNIPDYRESFASNMNLLAEYLNNLMKVLTGPAN